MAILFSRYVDITSAVAGGAVVARRELMGRLFTANNLLPPQSYIEFTSALEVGNYFGTSSEEYNRAVFYFGWISKNATRPQKIQYARWVNAAVAPRIYGLVATYTLATFTAITAGSFSLTINGVTGNFTGINFSTATNLADVATILQTTVQTGTGTMFTSATVTYDATRRSFNLVGGSTTAGAISVAEGVAGTPIAELIGWCPQATFTNGVFVDGAIWAAGSAVETAQIAFTNSVAASNNFGSFLYIPTLTIDQIEAIALDNHEYSVKFMYTIPVISANVADWTTALEEIGGCCLTLSDVAEQYPEQVPMMILAATAYENANSVQNYMFQFFDSLTASVTTDSVADQMDSLRVNYYGLTQQAGQQIAFYQRGKMLGISTDPSDMNVYANEQWLADVAGVAIMNLLLAMPRVSANTTGSSQILGVLQAVINQALLNGTISVGKILNQEQITFITEETLDVNAWRQVQNSGYWVNVIIKESDVIPTEYIAEYLLIYSKDDVIRRVVGRHLLI